MEDSPLGVVVVALFFVAVLLFALLADYLVRRGLAFRDAHEVVGKVVQLAESVQRELDALSLDELRGVCRLIDEDVFEVLTLEGSVCSRDHVGGTSPEQVRQAVAEARQVLAER